MGPKLNIPYFGLDYFQEFNAQSKKSAELQRERTLKKICETVIKKLDLELYEGTNPLSLSYGERKKLAFLSNTSHNPEILVLDEVNTGLDEVSKKKISDMIINHAKKERSVIIISHDLELINNIADRTFKFENGSMREIFQKGEK